MSMSLKRRYRPSVELLEDRWVPAVFNPTGLEQELLELLNHMRMDPQGHFARLVDSTSPIHSPDPDVNQALDFFNVSGTTLASQWATLTATAPLAWATGLYDAAHFHNQQMIAADEQSHQLPGEPGLGQRATNHGYSNWNALAENIFAFADSPFYAHAGFAIDWGFGPGGIQSPAGHRNNMMSGSYREVGIAVTPEANAGTQVGPLVVTQDFGNRSGFGNPWALGVVFNDLNADGFYQAGEGLGGVSVQIDGPGGTYSTTTLGAGGWQLKVAPGTYAVTFSGGGLGGIVEKQITVGSANAKVDARSQEAGGGGGGQNHAPVLAIAPAPAFSPVVTGDVNPAGNSAADLLGALATDADEGAVQGIAIVSVTGTSSGAWQQSLDGGATWTNLGTVSAGAARLLRPEDRLRFRPNAGFGGNATLAFHAWDQTAGAAGGTADLTAASSRGGATAYSVAKATATVFVNAAPVLIATAPSFGSQNEDTAAPLAKTISSLLTGKVTDANSGAQKGIAIFEVSGGGVWQYSANGRTWVNLLTVSADQAFLLTDSYRLRFRANANWNGAATFGYRAWDRTAGAALGFANLNGAVGGATAFSANAVAALLNVNPVNDAPALANGSPTFTPVNAGDSNPAGNRAADLLGLLVSDADPGALRGLAVSGLTGTSNGTWQYSLNDGQTWLNFGSVSSSAARLLRADDRIRFVPKAGFTGQASLTFRAWDQTTGTAGGTARVSSSSYHGGTKAFSSLRLTATLAVV